MGKWLPLMVAIAVDLEQNASCSQVIQVLEQLSLTRCQDVIIGTPLTRGISGMTLSPCTRCCCIACTRSHWYVASVILICRLCLTAPLSFWSKALKWLLPSCIQCSQLMTLSGLEAAAGPQARLPTIPKSCPTLSFSHEF